MTIQSSITAAVAPVAAPVGADVWRNGAFEPDTWTVLADGADIPAEGGVLVSVKRYLTEAEAGTLGNKPVGVVVAPADRVADLKPTSTRSR